MVGLQFDSDLGAAYGWRTPWAKNGAAVAVGFERRVETLVFNPDTILQTAELSGGGGAVTANKGQFTVKVGQQVDVRVPSANRTFPGKVARMEGRVDVATRTMTTEVDVQNPTLTLVPGMYAEVDLRLEQRDSVLAIPITAIERTGKSATVYRVASNRIEILPVVLGLETANRAEVKSGLRDGDLVVIGNRSTLHAGQQVKPKITAMDAAKEAK